MTNMRRTATRTRIVAGLAGIALGAGLLPALATPASAAVLIDGDGKSHVQAVKPWSANRGTLATTLGTTVAGLAARLAAQTGTDALSSIPKVTGNDGEKFRGAYAWVGCPFDTATKPIDGFCTVLQGKPDAGVKIEGGRVVPTGNTWVAADAQGALFGKTNTLTIPYESAGRWLTLAWTVQMLDQNGNPTGQYYNGQSPESILALPYNPELTTRPAVTSSAVAGAAWTGNGALWNLTPIGVNSGRTSAAAWLCTKAAAATDTTLLWDVTNGCTRLTPDIPSGSGAAPQLSGTLPANSAGKYLVINGVNTGVPNIVTAMQGSYSWAARSAAVQIAATPAEASAAPTAAADAAASGGAAGDAGAPSSAGADAAAAAGAGAGAGAASAAAIASGAGVDLAKNPLVGANGQGSGASAKLKMGLAASKKVNRGRYITVTAALTPKGSTGKVRIVLARANAKGKVIASKALFATVSKGKATKRWQIPRGYTAGAYSVVATYLPSKKGAPGVTAVAPVSIG